MVSWIDQNKWEISARCRAHRAVWENHWPLHYPRSIKEKITEPVIAPASQQLTVTYTGERVKGGPIVLVCRMKGRAIFKPTNDFWKFQQFKQSRWVGLRLGVELRVEVRWSIEGSPELFLPSDYTQKGQKY